MRGAQGKFWPMHDMLFEHQSHLEMPELRGYATQLQLDLAAYDREMNDGVHLPRVRDHIKSGRESGARSTPTFFVDGRICDVSYDLKALFVAVEAALRK
jgi:protein-disulfide isomerase